MTDLPLIEKKLALIETCVAELRRLARPALVSTDVREERFAEHTLQMAIQAALDVASHIASDERLGEPRTNRELFSLLERGGWVTAEFARTLSAMAGFRNILVHGYDSVDLDILRDVLEHRLDDLLAFVLEIRRRLPR
ncbi:MAG: type VII toxin-antitoxin system HepT family RNase toxin [Bacteroidales bacterium]